MRACSRLLTRITGLARVLMSLSWALILACGEGEMVMRELKKMDDVAYVRFASVYEDFQRVDDFHDAIREVKKPEKRARSAAK